MTSGDVKSVTSSPIDYTGKLATSRKGDDISLDNEPHDETLIRGDKGEGKVRVINPGQFTGNQGSYEGEESPDSREIASLGLAGRAAACTMAGIVLLGAVATSGGAAAQEVIAPETGGAAVMQELDNSSEPPSVLENYEFSTEAPAETALQEFPQALNLNTKAMEGVSAMAEAEQVKGVRALPNVEFHDVLRIDVVRATYSQQVESPPEVSPAVVHGENARDKGLTGQQDGRAPASPGAIKNTETRQRELAPFGVDLGNGLFYDINGNLTFNPLRLEEDFGKVTVDPWGAFNSTTIKRSGDNMTIDPPGLWNSLRINKGSGRITIDQPGVWNDTITITQKDGQTLIDPPGFNTWLGRTTIEEQGGRTTYDPPGALNSTTVTRHGEQTRIAIPGWGNDVTITESGGSIKIAYPGWANDTAITKSGNRTVINPAGWGNSITITREGNRIVINPSGLGNSVTITIRK